MIQANAAFTAAAWLLLRLIDVLRFACAKFARSWSVLDTSFRPWEARMTSSIWSTTKGRSVSSCWLKNIQNILLSVYYLGLSFFILGKDSCSVFVLFFIYSVTFGMQFITDSLTFSPSFIILPPPRFSASGLGEQQRSFLHAASRMQILYCMVVLALVSIDNTEQLW